MPYYDYKCSNEECMTNQGKLDSFEKFQSIKDDPLTDCEYCKTKGSLKRLISQTSFKFKGENPTPKHYM